MGARRILCSRGGAAAIAALAAASLAGCGIFGPPPIAQLLNRSDRPVTLLLTGTSAEPEEFDANEGLSIVGVDGTRIEGRGVCEGDGYVLTDTATGDVLATSDEPVCGETLIEIKEDGTVD